MKKYNLEDFKLGWLIGNFEPSILRTDKFEVSIKKYNKGDYEKAHFHKLANEITIITVGKVDLSKFATPGVISSGFIT